MLYRTIYIGNPAYLKLKDEQMEVIDPQTKEQKGRVPVEDLGVLVLDHFQITISHQLIQKLMGNKVAVISCDAHHLPFGLMLPLHGHTEHSDKVKDQLSASEPLKKQLWKQTVEAKIENQMLLLKQLELPYFPMKKYKEQIKTGDSTNREGIAAQHYWKHLISPDFIRERFGEFPNPFFNYGYIIVRSMMARAIVETGLLPVLGIFHSNKYNAYCLADDLIEPYRPLVDKKVMEWMKNDSKEEISKEYKAYILGIATDDVKIQNSIRPFMVAIKETTVSLYKSYTGEKRKIAYPVLE